MDKTRSKVRKLSELLQGKSSMVILMQDNPDPDAIGSAMALRKFANGVGDVACSITCGGTVGRAENRALVRYLDVRLRPFAEIDFEKFDLAAMVDTQPGTGNNSLPAGRIADIVIDHHPVTRATRSAAFTDIRTGYGATATIMWEYLVRAGITVEAQLATALLYAIRSDTQDFGREASRHDIEAVVHLFPIANNRMLGQIQRGSIERSYFRMLAAALKDARVYGECIVAGLGAMTNPDMVGEVADLLIREEGTTCTVCFGSCGKKMLLSIRTSEPDRRADKIVKHIVAGRGTAGGHRMFAGGQISLVDGSEAEAARMEGIIRRRCVGVLGLDSSSERKLVDM